jgi:trimeric autotransporter adhesin
VTLANGTPVVISRQGRLGVQTSSARFKEKIEPMNKVSEAILSLQPVTFRYKPEIDPESIPQFGLVAEEVAKVNPDLVARDDKGKPYTVRYEAVNAMLLNEFLKERRKVESLEKEMKRLSTALQKVSNELELMKPAHREVASDP